MRVYELLLKELAQQGTDQSNIIIDLTQFRFMLMLEKKYIPYAELSRWVLKPIAKDINSHSNMKIEIVKIGRPVNKLSFQVEIIKANKKTAANEDKYLHESISRILLNASQNIITLTDFEKRFLINASEKFKLNKSFSFLTEKQRTTLSKMFFKYAESVIRK
jgi:plasmid replication initiation protein